MVTYLKWYRIQHLFSFAVLNGLVFSYPKILKLRYVLKEREQGILITLMLLENAHELIKNIIEEDMTEHF